MQTTSFDFEEIGTRWRIDIPVETKPEVREFLFDQILSLIDDFDKIYSRFRDDSFIMKLSREKGTYTLPDTAKKLFDMYEHLYHLTDGILTPLIGQTLGEAGYDASYSLQPKELHRPPSWEKVITYRFPELTLHQPAILDFGAGGKGYLIDLVGELLEKNGFSFYSIDAGGDILYRDREERKLRVGLEDPDNASRVVGVAAIQGKSICGSAGNRRKWDRYHHIMNPTTLSSPDDIKATWVVADTTLLADILATALFFVSPEKLKKQFDFSYLILNADNSFRQSQAFPAKLFTA